MASLYKPLDASRSEVRMLKFVDLPVTDKSGLVHCVLEHISLEELTPGFQAFLSEEGHSCNPWSIEPWLQFTNRKSGDVSTSTGQLSLPSWRLETQYDEEAYISNKWKNTMEGINANLSRHPPINTYGDDTPWDFIGQGDTPVRLESLETRGHFLLAPRFQWGDFEAISYCWESETRDCHIVLDQTVFAIPGNLHALLQRLQRLPDAKSGMKFWIDALCIDQANLQEKGHQVKLMQSIYTKAFAVIVWLGETADESNAATDFISAITLLTPKKDKAQGGVGFGRGFEILEVAGDGEEIRNLFSEMPWKALLSFLSRNYWHRLWIIQELALNHTMTLFLCGEKRLSRSAIQRCSIFCMRNSMKIDQVIAQNPEIAASLPISGSIWPTVYQIHSLITMLEEPGHKWKLERILDLGRKARAKDPRDKVYGLLGILPEPIARAISPDYTLSRDMVYSQFAKILLQESKRVDEILSWCSYQADSNCSLPSWIPDWTTEFVRNHIRWLRRRRASGSTPALWSISEDGRHLRCRGLIVDSIESASASPSENLPYRTALPKKSENSTPTGLKTRYGDHGMLLAALRRTLIVDNPYQGGLESIFNICWMDWDEIKLMTESDQHLSDILHAMKNVMQSPFWEDFDRFRQTNAGFDIFGHSFREFFPSINKYSRPTTSSESLSRQSSTPEFRPVIALETKELHDMQRAALAFVGRRMVTTEGGYLGIAPEAVQKGDLIAIIHGCGFPVVLRKCNKFYLVIGESYIDGIMDGELMEAKERGDYCEVELTFC